jgi:peroxin-19
VLEQFSAPSTSTSKPTIQSKQKEPSVKDEEIDEEDFAKQFAAEMEAFMKGLVDPGSKPSAEPVDPEAEKQAEALRKAWEQLLVEDLEGEEEEDTYMATPAVASGSKPKAAKSTESSKESTSKVEDEFQKAVKQAMEKLKESDDSSKVRNCSVT